MLRFLVLAFLMLMAQSATAQDHLIPDNDVLVDPDSYKLKVRHVFRDAFENRVTIRVIVLPSFKDEYAVGLREKDGTSEVFLLEPSSRIWATELLEMYEEGKIRMVATGGKQVPLEENEHYKALKETAPADYRQIKARRKARPIPADVAKNIKAIWDEMLLSVRHPAEPMLGADGVMYYFSASIPWRGDISGHIWSPEPDSKTGRLVALANSLVGYAKGELTLEEVETRQKTVAKP